MKQSQGSEPSKRASARRPPPDGAVKGNSHGPSVEPEVEVSSETRIRVAAYALYEARGHVDGHDVADWLSAEATLGAQSSDGGSKPEPMGH